MPDKKQTMRDALSTIARDVERTESKDLYKLRELATRALSGPEASFVDDVRAILEDPENSGADCYDHIAGLLRDLGKPVRDVTEEPCPDDPDGLHHVGCGCES